MASSDFKTAEEYILAQKYNRLHRKGRLIQNHVRDGWSFIISGPQMFVLEKDTAQGRMVYSIWGSVFFPKTDLQEKSAS